MVKMAGRMVSTLFVFFVGCTEPFHGVYPDVAALEAGGPGARSWFPRRLPSSARQLEERHIVDVPKAIGRFEFSSSELGDVRRMYPPLDAQSFRGGRLRMEEEADWPPCLVGRVTYSGVLRCGFEPRRAGQLEVALDPLNHRVFFWTPE